MAIGLQVSPRTGPCRVLLADGVMGTVRITECGAGVDQRDVKTPDVFDAVRSVIEEPIVDGSEEGRDRIGTVLGEGGPHLHWALRDQYSLTGVNMASIRGVSYSQICP